MKNKSLTKRIVAALLAFTVIFGATAPLTSVNAEAAGRKTVDAHIQAESVRMLPKAKLPIATVGAIFKGITLAVKGVGAIKYATENHKYQSSESWVNLAFSYFSGNAHKLPIDNLRDAMVSSFEMTNASIKELEDQIITLQGDIAKLSSDLDKLSDTVVANDLKARLDDFYTNFFYPSYSALIEAYDAVGNALEDENVNEATLRAKLDDLYMKANEMKKLDSYITGKAFFDDKGILDIYYEYTLLANGISADGSDTYYNAVSTVQDFAMKLYAASALQKLCTSYASSYQLHYYHEHYEEMVAAGGFVGYVVEGSSNLSTNKLTEYEIKKNISSSASEVNANSGKIAKILARIYLLDAYVGYIEDGAAYYAPVNSSKLNVYAGATYNLFSIASELEEIFEYDLTFVSDNDAVSISPNGSFTIDESVKNSFKIAYVYGEGMLGTPITVYEITFTPATRVFSGGYGSESSPYLISSAEQYKSFASNTAYHTSGVYTSLISDLTLSDEFNTVSEYNGIFDGANHTISGISRSSALFSTNNGTVKNLTVNSATINLKEPGSWIVGAVADINTGKIINCHLKNSTVKAYCHNYKNSSTAYTSFTATVGGIVGSNSGTVEYCSVTSSCNIRGEASTKEMFDNGKVFSSDDMTIKAGINIGGIAGDSSGIISNCYVGDSTISSKTYAKYYKWVLLWEHTYNRVKVNVKYGNIVGSNSGENSSNLYYNVTNSSHDVQKIAAEKTDNGFVTGTPSEGVHGTQTSASSPSSYLTSISVKSSLLQTKYLEGDVFNFAGLELVDNMGNPIYGFKIDGFSSNAPGERKIKLGYKGVESEVTVNIGCEHKHIRVDEKVNPTCISDGWEAGVYCLTCEQYVDGHGALPKSNEYCKDENRDHNCDICGATISECTDSTDHLCDICGKTVSTCTDANKDHLCDTCSVKLSDCKDENGDHKCDTCEDTVSECTDSTDHICDICGKMVSICADTNRDHLCDTCGEKLSECADDNKDHLCDTCSVKLSDCKDENGDHKCDTCEDTVSECTDSTDHICDICGKMVSICADTNRDHLCDTCGEKLSECADDNKDHLCDTCSVKLSDCKDENSDYYCDVCEKHLCNCVDENRDHICDICGIKLSDCSSNDGDYLCDVCLKNLCMCIDKNNDHKCDTCTVTISECSDSADHLCDVCGEKISECFDVDNNYRCDICNKKVCDCADLNKDHFCDNCKDKLTECFDNDDHRCDICNMVVSQHYDFDNHNCDICNMHLTNHSDMDKNHFCDVCLVSMGTHEAGVGKHICDYCGVKVTACLDENDDHLCDVCNDRISQHIDSDDHRCDVCDAKVSVHSDEDKNHKCDVCSASMGVHEVASGKHICDYCGVKIEECFDADANHVCDVCYSTVGKHQSLEGSHSCFYCGGKVSDCADTDRDRLCDVCGAEISGSLSTSTVVAITAASTAGCGGLGFGLWSLLKRRRLR